MNPDPYGAPPQPPPPNYDFILAGPTKASKPSKGLGTAGSGSFMVKLAVLLGGAILLIIVIVVGSNLFLGDKTNVADLTTLTQTESEIIRVSGLSSQSSNPLVLNAAINTKLSLTTHQNQWLSYLAKKKTKVSAKQLLAKKSTATDKTLTAAQSASTFDATFITIMRKQLTDYASEIKTAYDNSLPTAKTERNLLHQDYQQVALLLQQWPANTD